MGFQKGNKMAGSRKGVPNKATAELRAMIDGALSELGGQAYLVQQARENPSSFLALIGKTLPREVTGPNGGPIKHAIKVVWG
jgi:hypothetical protein